MPEITKAELIAIPLKYGTNAGPLKSIALAQIVAKALFSCSNSATSQGIREEIKKILTYDVSIEKIEHCLSLLQQEGKVKKEDGKWTLDKEAALEISGITGEYQSLQKNILERLFPKIKNKQTLERWFESASVEFFYHHSDEWVNSVYKNTTYKPPKVQTIESLLEPSIKKYGLGDYKEELVESFKEFLLSKTEEDRRHLANLGYAAFSARLVASDLGADPITLQELTGSTFILDTNFLFAVAHDQMAVTMSALGEALNRIKVKTIYLYITKEEYKRALSGVKGEVMGLYKKYPFEVLKDTDNDFIQAAVALGARTKEDFERFFDGISTIPERIPNGPKITLEDYPDIKEVTEKAENDKKLKKELKQLCIKLRPLTPKSPTAIIHDAGLLRTGEMLRNGEKKYWIISLDGIIRASSINQSSPQGLPLVLNLVTLVQLLAMNEAGPGLNASNFAHLLSKMIMKRCIPPSSMYTTGDLHVLHNINKNVENMPPEKIKEILKIVTKARIEGKSEKDETLQRAVNNLFHEKKLEVVEEIEEGKRLIEAVREESEVERGKRKEVEDKLVESEAREIERVAVKRFWKKTIIYTLGLVILGSVSFYLMRKYGWGTGGDLISIGVSLLLAIPLIYDFHRDLKEEKKEATQKARETLGL